MRRFAWPLFAVLVLAGTTSASAQPLEPIVFTVRFPNPAKGEVQVEALVPTGKQPAIDMMMPVWTPGYYRVENYAGQVSNFKAQTLEGKELPFERPGKNRWTIDTGGAHAVRLTYELACTSRSVTGNWVGEDLVILNGGPTFMTLAEKVKRPHEVRLELQDAWKDSATGLTVHADGKPHHYVAPDHATLVDSPIMAGNLTVTTFDVGGSQHQVVAGGDTAAWDGQRAAADLKKIAVENQRLWGTLPFKKYVFLFAVRDKGAGGGGLEHANSALMMSSSSATRGAEPYLTWLRFVSHEYFHAFNVKRLRPVELGPFDFEKEPRTSGLWVAEGLTTYYGDLLVARAGFTSGQDHLSRVSAQIDRLQKSPGRLVQTLHQSSLDVWTSGTSGIGGGPETISYYVKGAVVGYLLDAKIQRATQGERSLDDVMRLAYHRYGGERGFSAEQFRRTAEDIAGIDLQEPFRKWLDTTEELDYAEALDWFGLQFAAKTWRLEVREHASDAQREHLKRWLAKTEYRSLPADKTLPDTKVAAIPDEVSKRYKLDTTFYKKHLDYRGFSILSSAKVSDEALYEARYLIHNLLHDREDILGAMIKTGCRFMVMAPTEMTTDVPEQRHLKDDKKTNWDQRARGLGGKLSSCGEENLLNLKGDRYRQENILIHEFNHAIHQQGLRIVDPTFNGRLKKAYDSAMEKGLWKGTYVATNPAEYWAEAAQAYFDCMRPQFGANTREKLQKYDPDLFALVDEVYKQSKFRYARYDQRKKKEAVTIRQALAHDESQRLAPTLPGGSKLGGQPLTAASVEQTEDGKGPAPQVVAAFDGLGDGFEGPHGMATLRNPSDNSLAVGPDHIVQLVNTRMAVFTKKGKKFDTTGKVLYGPVNTGNVFKGFGDFGDLNGGDAVVRYDQLADRWLIVMPIFRRLPFKKNVEAGKSGGPVQLSLPGVAEQPGPARLLHQPALGEKAGAPNFGKGAKEGSYAICYAVSTSADPLGSYYRYMFERPLFPDYPRPAVWPDGYYVTTSTSDFLIQRHAHVVDRARMLKGEPATEQGFILDDVVFLLNADLDGKQLPPAGAPNIMMTVGGAQLKNVVADDGIYWWKFHVDWQDASKSKLVGPVKVPVAPYEYLGGGQLTRTVPQPGTTQKLDVQGDKLMARLIYRRIGEREIIVGAQSVKTAAGGGGIRWYEFRLDKDRNVKLHQQGTYAPDKFYRWMPSPAVDGRGNIGIGYSFGGTPHFPGQRFTGRLADDPPGQLTLREVVLAEGEAAQAYTNRWQDYTQTAIDPTDDMTIWYVGDYLKKGATHYSTRIGAFRLPVEKK